MLATVLRSLGRQLNRRRRRWSTANDRAFHDSIFAGHHYDPFTPAYPGYLTIRRFADLAGEHVRPGDLVLDLGCGPGEVTCELARRFPSSRFVGVDHSCEALSRAEALRASRALTNARFEQADLETFALPTGTSLVTMFDAFHHVLEPASFAGRLGSSCDRIFLLEPAGDWLGRWQRSLDLDWVAETVFGLADRLEYQFGLEANENRDQAARPPANGEPTEHRYAMEDFLRWFPGFGIDVRGTIAGLERYGQQPHADGRMRAELGGISYDLVVRLEDLLRAADLDLAAKHWAVYAERGARFAARRPPRVPPRLVRPAQGPYDAEYGEYDGPTEGTADTVFGARVRVSNRSWREWDSRADDDPVLLSYHWLDSRHVTIVQDGLRSPLPRPVAPGDACPVALKVACPREPGQYILAIELVHEGVTWFSAAGTPPLQVPFRVRP